MELKLNPNRLNSLLGAGRAAEVSNQSRKAVAYYEQVIKTCDGGSSTRPEIAHARAFVSAIAQRN